MHIYTYIYMYIYIFIDICKSCKSDMGKNKSLQSSYIFLLSGATNRYEPIEIKLIIKNTNLRVRVGWFVNYMCAHPLFYRWIPLSWMMRPDVYPSLPGSRMPVLRILTEDEKFGRVWVGILWCPQYRTYRTLEEHLIKITPKLIIDHLSCIISIASNGRIPGFFHCINSQRRLTNRDRKGRQSMWVGSARPSAAKVALTGCLIVLMGVCTLLINFTLCWLTAIPAWMRDLTIIVIIIKNVSSLLMDWNNVSFALSDQCNGVSRPQRVNIDVGSLGPSELIYLWDL